MARRLDKIARMVSVQKQMHRLAEWRLIEFQQREQHLRQQAQDVICSLNEDVPLHGMFVDSMGRRLRSLGIQAGAVAAAKDRQAERVRLERRKLRHAERMEETAMVEAQRDREKRALEEAVGNALVRRAVDLDPPSSVGEDDRSRS